ncbi:hypothetical protein ABNF97_27720 [Plantactinospora sp. B6F1]|uniref:hypothetical protein n=1 Tax=Plantactinospora sp. B6F1 TaxID=3158971 RepID=UPI0032D97F78
MTATRFPAVVEIGQLGRLPDTPLANGGQCEGVWVVPAAPSLLFKKYTLEVRRQTDSAALDRLIAEPSAMSRDQRRLVETATAWPSSRVTDGGDTVGVLLPRAPDAFTVAWRSPTDVENPARRTTLEIDLLAKPDRFLTQRAIPAQPAAERATMCTTLARIAALFEERGLVYADWSYANAFWQPVKHEVFLLDIDGCSFGPRDYVITPNFDDPKTPPGTKVDNYTDRYRAALLIARCLTTVRDVEPLTAALSAMSGAAPATLRRILVEARRDARPPLAELAAAFTGTMSPAPSTRPQDTTGVVDWVEWSPSVKRTKPAPQQTRPARATASTSQPATPKPAPPNGSATTQQDVTAGTTAFGCGVLLFLIAAVAFGVVAVVHWLV